MHLLLVLLVAACSGSHDVDDAAIDASDATRDADADAISDSDTGCPPSIVEDAPCSPEGMSCGGERCTNACDFCNVFTCRMGRWGRVEVFPAPCFDCFGLRCAQDSEVCILQVNDPGVPTCWPTPAACRMDQSCECLVPEFEATMCYSNDAGTGVTLYVEGMLEPADAMPRYTFESNGTLDGFRMSTIRNQPGRDDPGRFDVVDGALVAMPGTDLGVLVCTTPLPADFELELEWKRSAEDDNSGVFLRFPDVDSKGYDNTAWVAIDFGYEVQIDETGSPDGAAVHTTGAIYSVEGQDFTRVVARPVGEWNRYVIRVRGDEYTVELNGERTTHAVLHQEGRGLASTEAAPSYFGLQTHTGHVAYRNIRVRAL